MKTHIDYIKRQIEEREHFNSVARKLMETSKTVPTELRDFSNHIRSCEKTLNQMLVNSEVIALLNNIPALCTEDDVNEQLEIFNTKIGLLEKQVEELKLVRADMRKAKMFNEEQNILLNHKIRSITDVRQLYVQAHADVDGIIDCILD